MKLQATTPQADVLANSYTIDKLAASTSSLHRILAHGLLSKVAETIDVDNMSKQDFHYLALACIRLSGISSLQCYLRQRVILQATPNFSDIFQA